MAGILNQIAGAHGPTYERLYQKVNPAGSPTIPALQAANFMKTSGLSSAVLGQVWDIADSEGNGFLDKKGFFIALKLISLAQNGKEISPNNLTTSSPPPWMGEVMSPTASIDDPVWKMKPLDRTRFEKMFEGLGPILGKLTGEQVKQVMMESRLSTEVLGKIWQMSDIDMDGMLDVEEFCLAMQLIYSCLDGVPLPHELPADVIRRCKHPPTASTAAPSAVGGLGSPTSRISQSVCPVWVVTVNEKVASDKLFLQADTNKDGLVSGVDIKDIFIASGLPQPVLAQIWNLCDLKGSGLLNSEQFALALHLIHQSKLGKEVPTVWTPELIPPSMSEFLPNRSRAMSSGINSIRELDSINKEIEDLAREKASLQSEITQRGNSLRAGRVSVEEMKAEVERFRSVRADLQNQKTTIEAQLKSLEDERIELESTLSTMKLQISKEEEQISNLQTALKTQKQDSKRLEEQLAKERKELENLQAEELKLTEKINQDKMKLLSIKAEVSKVKDVTVEVQNKIEEYRRELNGGGSSSTLSPGAARQTNQIVPAASTASALQTPSLDVGKTASSFPDHFAAPSEELIYVDLMPPSDVTVDPFKTSDPFSAGDLFSTPTSLTLGQVGTSASPFGGSIPKKTSFPSAVPVVVDPFSLTPTPAADPFASNNALGLTINQFDTGTVDPFAGHVTPADPFSSPPAGKLSQALVPSPGSGLTMAASNAFSTSSAPSDSFEDPFRGFSASSSKPPPTAAAPTGWAVDPFAAAPAATEQPPSTISLFATSSVAGVDFGSDPFGGFPPVNKSHSDAAADPWS